MLNERIITGKKYRILSDIGNKIWDRISFWTKASDVEFNNGKNAEDIYDELSAKAGITLTATLKEGNTSVSFTNSSIKDDSMIDVYTDTYGVNPTNMSVSGTTLTITFDAQSKDVNVKVRVM